MVQISQEEFNCKKEETLAVWQFYGGQTPGLL
jgi:hypothetical protein